MTNAPGDGHLVHAVPAWALHDAAQLQIDRGAGFGVVTDLGEPDPFADLPAWCDGLLAETLRAPPQA